MSLTRKQRALLAVTVKHMGWSDAIYRSVLAQVGGVTTLKALDAEGFEAVSAISNGAASARPRARGRTTGRGRAWRAGHSSN